MNEITQTVDNSVIIENFGQANLVQAGSSLKSGYTPAVNDAIVQTELVTIVEPTLTQVTASALTGVDDDNTSEKVLYLEISVSGSDNVLEVFKDSGRAAGDLVANSTDTSKAGGALTLTAQNSSGLGGTITIIASAVADANASIVYSNQTQRYDGDVAIALQEVKGIASDYDSSNGVIRVLPRCSAKLDGVGKDNVVGDFSKKTMIKHFKDHLIELI